MPIKTSSGKWKWGNVERSSKKELVQTVYGIWKKNGSKGSFSDFLKGTHESIEEQKEKYFVTDLDYNKHVKPVLDILKKWKRMEIGNITKHADDKSMKWFGIYRGRSIEDIVALAAVYIDKADKEIFFNQINSGEKGMGKYLTDRMIEYFKKNKNGCDHISWLSDPGSGEQLKDFYRKNFPDAEETEEKNEWWQTSKFTLKLKESVEPKDKFFKVKKNGKEIGKYGLSFYDDIKAVGIGDLEVYPEFRNKGYGTKIIKDIVDRYKNDYDKIYCFVDKDNKDAIRLYKRLGKVSDEVTYSQKIGDYEYKNKNGQHYVEFYNKLKESYEPPYTLDTIKQKYGVEAYRKLRDDPVHRFRAETGIEVIHKEPTRDEFERIVKNWDLMTPEQKKQSDEFSMKQFGKNNHDRIDNIRKEYFNEEKWSKNERYFYCDDCNKNMVKAPDDQYIMIDDDLWEYVCKHGGKKIELEDVLCRDCIEKRLGRRLTLKDLGDKINLPINDEIRKMLKKGKNKMTNEAHEIHSYPEKLQSMLERIVKDNEDYELDHAYFNKEGKFIWMRNLKGYFHVFKPVKFVKTPGMTKPFGFKDLILKDNGMLEEVDRLRFTDGNEGLKFLKDKYHLELKTIK